MPASDEIKSKGGAPIHEGDTVNTPYRGGKREGQVEKVVTTQEEADEEGVGKAPKVVFTDQNEKKVAHKPGTLTNLDKE